MKKRTKACICGLLALSFLILCGFFTRRNASVFVHVRQENGKLSASARISCKDTAVTIDSFQLDSGDSILFLPFHAEGETLVLDGITEKTKESVPAGEDGADRVESGMTVPAGGEHELTILTGSEIPSVFLELTHELSYIQSDKELSDSGQAVILYEDGECAYSGNLEKIKGRGNTSWEQEKKSYNLTLKEPASLRGMKTSAEYALVSSSDTSFLRNRISGDLAEEAGTSSMEGMWINLYINGEYEGVYELYEKITPANLGIYDLERETEQLNPYRNSIYQNTTGKTWEDWNQSVTGKWWTYATEPDNVSGGYLLEADSILRYAEESSGFITEGGVYLVAKSPACLSEKQYQYISSYIQDCENAMTASVGQNGDELLAQYMDVDSFVGKYLVEEISKNIDSSVTSQFFYKDRDGVLYAGPVWDYDWAYGARRVQEGIDYQDPEGFAARDIPGTLTWWQLLYYNDSFYQKLTATYREKLYPCLNDLVDSGLAEWEEELSDSAVMDYLRWNRAESTDPVVIREAYHGEVQKIADFLSVRKEFLYTEWSSREG